jgi:hypothetical protein
MGEVAALPWREWITGKAPNTAQTHVGVLPPPRLHDTPSPPRLSRGRVCPVKACRTHDPTATHSVRFWPTGLCVACWQRWHRGVS